MQQLQPSAASQSHNPPMQHLGYFSSSHLLRHTGLVFLVILLLAVSAITASRLSKERQAMSMQTVSDIGSATKTSAQVTNTPNVKSVGTDPPPQPNKITVSVNGQNIAVPSQGNTSQTIINGNTKTDVEVTNSSSSTEGLSDTSASSLNNLDISVSSDSTSTSSSSNY